MRCEEKEVEAGDRRASPAVAEFEAAHMEQSNLSVLLL